MKIEHEYSSVLERIDGNDNPISVEMKYVIRRHVTTKLYTCGLAHMGWEWRWINIDVHSVYGLNWFLL